MMTNPSEILFFSSFLIFIILLLVTDLGLFQKKSHALSFKEALTWTLIWVGISIAFYYLIRFHGNWIHGTDTLEELRLRISSYRHPINIEGMGLQEALRVYNHNLSLEYLTGYLIEYSLSVDNIFVMILIFYSFKINPKYFKRVLFWGILGAIIMRFIFIFGAGALIHRFAWFLYIFGGMLVIIGAKMAYEFFYGEKEDHIDTENHPVVKLISRFFKVTHEDHGEKFWIRQNRKLYITPLLIVLLVIEFTDVLFAIDSVPAVFSITQDPYIVFFSNIFAILGLRSLFFLVMNVMDRFYYLKMGLAVLLTFIGLKMLGQTVLKIDTRISLYIIASILAVSIIASNLRNVMIRKKEKGKKSETGF
jgi:tellurite resistance protein TerC